MTIVIGRQHRQNTFKVGATTSLKVCGTVSSQSAADEPELMYFCNRTIATNF